MSGRGRDRVLSGSEGRNFPITSHMRRPKRRISSGALNHELKGLKNKGKTTGPGTGPRVKRVGGEIMVTVSRKREFAKIAGRKHYEIRGTSSESWKGKGEAEQKLEGPESFRTLGGEG